MFDQLPFIPQQDREIALTKEEEKVKKFDSNITKEIRNQLFSHLEFFEKWDQQTRAVEQKLFLKRKNQF